MRLSIIFMAVLLLALSGCSDKSSNPGVTENPAPASGTMPENVQNLLDEYLNESDDALASAWLATVDSNAIDVACHSEAYAVTFLWGDLFNAGPATAAVTDWSGTLSINAAATITVRLTIDFEEGEDSILVTESSAVSAWVSKTSMDLDGISFIVCLRTDAAYFSPPILKFETAPITLQFYPDELISLDEFYMADNRSGVVVHSRRIWQNSCPGGTITGQWIKEDNAGEIGHITGFWIDFSGDTLGIMSGTFGGPTPSDTRWRQFRGSVSGLILDVVLFEFNGYWYYDDMRECAICGQGHGLFWGRFHDLMNNRRGLMAGQFGDYSLPPDDIAMPLTGYWQYFCPWAIQWPADH